MLHINKINAYADYWRNNIGVNVIPADSVIKKTWVQWKDDPRGNWQVEPIPQEIHDDWKKKGSFEKGMAIICGKVFHNPEKEGLYLCAIDADNQKGIEVLHSKGLEYLSTKTLVEQHANPNKAHVYFYTHKPMPKKSSDAVNLELLEKMNKNEIPALEMKGDGTHGIMYCTPSPHKDGSNYQIIGIDEPAILDDIGEVINKICDEYSLGRGNNNRVPMKTLMDDETRVIEGSNRHEAIMRYAESILRKTHNKGVILEESVFKEVVKAKNKLMCSPPLSEGEIDTQIECAVKFIDSQIEEERRLRDMEKRLFGTDAFWEDVVTYRKAFNPEGSFIKCIDCEKFIEPDPLDRTHYNHNVVFK